MPSTKNLFAPKQPMAPLTASPEFRRPSKTLTSESESLSPRSTPKSKGKSPMTSPSTSSMKAKGKKSIGSRGKCHGCIKRDSIIEVHKLFERQVAKKADKIEDGSGQAIGCFLQIQEYLDIVAPLVNNIGKIASQLSNDANLSPKKTDIIDLERSP